ncbi:MAG: ABC transporter permease [Acidobacteria bacterium]|nr:MAG: ABC transporter permease [Acidobacteriota bacterium]
MENPDRRPTDRTLALSTVSRPGVLRNRAVIIPALIVLLIAGASLLGPAFLPFTYWETHLELGASPPSLTNGHYLGTDLLGRDLLARMLYGGRISLLVGFLSTAVSLLIGVPYGAIAGYLGGRIDEIMMRIVDVLYSLPYMFIVILLVALFAQPGTVDALVDVFDLAPHNPIVSWLRGPGLRLVFLFMALGAVSWLTLARIVRGQVLVLKNAGFIDAARALGQTPARIIVRHVIPNTLGVIIVYTTLTIPSVILQEAFLSFLGLGIRPPQASWGTLVSEGMQALAVAPWLLIFPGGMLVLTLLSLNFLGDGLRDALDVRI